MIQATICLVMTMLPSSMPPQVDDVSLITVCVSDLVEISTVKDILFPTFAGQKCPIIETYNEVAKRLVTLFFVQARDARPELIEASDGFVLVLDGGIGLSPGEISAWNHAVDHTIARHILAFNVHSSRADFDEVVAIVERVLEPDVMVRYLPIEDDDENHFAGIYDVLTGDIHDYSSGSPLIRHGDPEHMSLTAEKREVLFDELAHYGLDDANLDAHSLGMPINIPSLERIWKSPEIVSVIPVDDGVGNEVLGSWLDAVTPRWLPSVTEGSSTYSVNETKSRIGLCVADGVVRMWGPSAQDNSLELRTTQRTNSFFSDYETRGLAIVPEAHLGEFVVRSDSDAELFAPNF